MINIDLNVLLNAVVFSVVGIVIFIIAGFIFEKITPFNIWDEVTKNKNVAVAIVVGSAFLGLAIIVASAHG